MKPTSSGRTSTAHQQQRKSQAGQSARRQEKKPLNSLQQNSAVSLKSSEMQFSSQTGKSRDRRPGISHRGDIKSGQKAAAIPRGPVLQSQSSHALISGENTVNKLISNFQKSLPPRKQPKVWQPIAMRSRLTRTSNMESAKELHQEQSLAIQQDSFLNVTPKLDHSKKMIRVDTAVRTPAAATVLLQHQASMATLKNTSFEMQPEAVERRGIGFETAKRQINYQRSLIARGKSANRVKNAHSTKVQNGRVGAQSMLAKTQQQQPQGRKPSKPVTRPGQKLVIKPESIVYSTNPFDSRQPRQPPTQEPPISIPSVSPERMNPVSGRQTSKHVANSQLTQASLRRVKEPDVIPLYSRIVLNEKNARAASKISDKIPDRKLTIQEKLAFGQSTTKQVVQICPSPRQAPVQSNAAMSLTENQYPSQGSCFGDHDEEIVSPECSSGSLASADELINFKKLKEPRNKPHADVVHRQLKNIKLPLHGSLYSRRSATPSNALTPTIRTMSVNAEEAAADADIDEGMFQGKIINFFGNEPRFSPTRISRPKDMVRDLDFDGHDQVIYVKNQKVNRKSIETDEANVESGRNQSLGSGTLAPKEGANFGPKHAFGIPSRRDVNHQSEKKVIPIIDIGKLSGTIQIKSRPAANFLGHKVSAASINSTNTQARQETIQLNDPIEKYPRRTKRLDAAFEMYRSKPAGELAAPTLSAVKSHDLLPRRESTIETISGYQQYQQIQRAGSNERSYENLLPDELVAGSRLSLRLKNLNTLPAKTIEEYPSRSTLTHLDLRNNRLSHLPTSALASLALLTDLRLDYNFLSTLPSGLNELRNLRLLSASQNSLRNVPEGALSENLITLILHDNKIASLPDAFGKLKQLSVLLLQNNCLFELPASIGKPTQLTELGLDWLLYLWQGEEVQQVSTQRGHSFVDSKRSVLDQRRCLLSAQTKVIRADEATAEGREHMRVLQRLRDLCKLTSVLSSYRSILEHRQQNQANPQQDDDEDWAAQTPVQQLGRRAGEMVGLGRRGGFARPASPVAEQTTSPAARSLNHPEEVVNFLQFIMYFYLESNIDKMILYAIYPSKQRRLAHVISLCGHSYIMSQVIVTLANAQAKRNANYTSTSLRHQLLYSFVNAVDTDFSTPLILSLKNRRSAMVRLLLDNDKICLRQASLRFGTPIHVALSNQDFKSAMRILNMTHRITVSSSSSPEDAIAHELDKPDEDGNTAMHVLMQYFGADAEKAQKIATRMLKHGASLTVENRQGMTPLHLAFFFQQTEAIKFAIDHNLAIKDAPGGKQFDFNSQSNKLAFTPLHHAVCQNSVPLVCLLVQFQRETKSLDFNLQDVDGCTAVDRCGHMVSSIQKTLKRSQRQQRFAKMDCAHILDRSLPTVFDPFSLKHLAISVRHRPVPSVFVGRRPRSMNNRGGVKPAGDVINIVNRAGSHLAKRADQSLAARRPDPTAISPPKLKRINLATQIADSDLEYSPVNFNRIRSRAVGDRGGMLSITTDIGKEAGAASMLSGKPPRSRQHDGLGRGGGVTTFAGSRLGLGAIQLMRTQDSAVSFEGRLGPLSGRQQSQHREPMLQTSRQNNMKGPYAAAPANITTEYRSVYQMTKELQGRPDLNFGSQSRHKQSVGSQRDLIPIQQHNHLDYTPSMQLTSQASLSPMVNNFALGLDSDRCNVFEDANALGEHERPRIHQNSQSQLDVSSNESQAHLLTDYADGFAPRDEETAGSRAVPNTSEYSAMQQKLRSRAGSFAILSRHVNVWERDAKSLFLKLFEFHGVQSTKVIDLQLLHEIRSNFFENEISMTSNIDSLVRPETTIQDQLQSGSLSYRMLENRSKSDLMMIPGSGSETPPYRKIIANKNDRNTLTIQSNLRKYPTNPYVDHGASSKRYDNDEKTNQYDSDQAPSSVSDSLHWRRSAGILHHGLTVKTKPVGDTSAYSSMLRDIQMTPNADITEDDAEATQQRARHFEFTQAAESVQATDHEENCNETEVTVGPSKKYPELMRHGGLGPQRQIRSNLMDMSGGGWIGIGDERQPHKSPKRATEKRPLDLMRPSLSRNKNERKEVSEDNGASDVMLDCRDPLECIRSVAAFYLRAMKLCKDKQESIDGVSQEHRFAVTQSLDMLNNPAGNYNVGILLKSLKKQIMKVKASTSKQRIWCEFLKTILVKLQLLSQESQQQIPIKHNVKGKFVASTLTCVQLPMASKPFLQRPISPKLQTK